MNILELIPINSFIDSKNNKLYIDKYKNLNINNDLQLNNLNINEKNNIINFDTNYNIQFNNDLIYNNKFTTMCDSRLMNNIVDIDDISCLNILNKIVIKQTNINNENKISIINDNLSKLLPHSIKYVKHFIRNINKYYLFKINDDEIIINDLEDGMYRLIDDDKITYDLEFKNNKSKKNDNMNIRNKVFIYGNQINDYKLTNNDDLLPIIIKSIQELDKKYNNIIDDVNKITTEKTSDFLNYKEIILNLNNNYQKLYNKYDIVQNKLLQIEINNTEKEYLKNKIENLEKQLSIIIKKL